jgi:transposase
VCRWDQHSGGSLCSRGQKRGAGESFDSNEALGRSRGGFGTKIHFLCDRKGNPLSATLSPGQDHESRYLDEVLDADVICGNELGEPIVPVRLAGDKGYRMDRIDEALIERGIVPVIPSKSNEDRSKRIVEFDQTQYRRRSIVEQMIGWLKECRRVATRFEKRARHYLSMVKLAMIGRYLRKMAPVNSQV